MKVVCLIFMYLLMLLYNQCCCSLGSPAQDVSYLGALELGPVDSAEHLPARHCAQKQNSVIHSWNKTVKTIVRYQQEFTSCWLSDTSSSREAKLLGIWQPRFLSRTTSAAPVSAPHAKQQCSTSAPWSCESRTAHKKRCCPKS